jgi:SAM-dependent methyltransferase
VIDTVLAGYAASSKELIARFEETSSDQLYSHMIDLLPGGPANVTDIGAGTGRDAAWLADKGHLVTAVEPVYALRNAGMNLHRSPNIHWLDDRLPTLNVLRKLHPFDLVLMSAVWHHLTDDQRPVAMRSLADVTTHTGILIMSIRHGPGAHNRPVFPASDEATRNMATSVGFEVMREVRAASVQAGNQAAGVHWTWLGLRRR